MEKKMIAKDELLKKAKIELGLSSPLFAYVGRLAEQKGVDIIADIAGKIIKLGGGLVLLGSGDEKYERIFGGLAKKYQKKIGVTLAFDNKLAHLIEAGSDMFLMPSRYEPCGLNQMYSLKYGTIPVVRATGGLDDTIIDYTDDPAKGNGFKFSEATPEGLFNAIKRAMKLFKNQAAWIKLTKRVMGLDFSWKSSAEKYKALYKEMTHS